MAPLAPGMVRTVAVIGEPSRCGTWRRQPAGKWGKPGSQSQPASASPDQQPTPQIQVHQDWISTVGVRIGGSSEVQNPVKVRRSIDNHRKHQALFAVETACFRRHTSGSRHGTLSRRHGIRWGCLAASALGTRQPTVCLRRIIESTARTFASHPARQNSAAIYSTRHLFVAP